MRHFEVVEDKFRACPDQKIILPVRGTANSACYDIFSPGDFIVKAHSNAKVKTDVCVCMESDEVLNIYPRSSMGKIPVILANTVGIIDSDYYHNESNGGNIIIMLHNMSNDNYVVKTGDRIAQCMFTKYLITDDDDAKGVRTGGIGSTGV